jgi:dienelactone hydrolase
MIIRLSFVLALLFPVTAFSAEAYKPDAGPFDVVVNEAVVDPGNRALALRIAYPSSGGPYPVVVLSHGGGCAGGSYSVVGDHWASHGYVVIQPTHPDSRSTGFDMAAVEPRMMEGIVRQRMGDMSLVLDSLRDLETLLPTLAGKIDHETLIAAGHSMGAATTLSVTGMVIENPFSRQKIASSEDRFDAALLLSEPGHNPTLPEEPWRVIAIPTFVYTGTDDYGSESRENSNIPFQYAMVSTVPDPAPAKHHLWIDGVNHYLSGGWCSATTDASYDNEAVTILNGVSTAFLDAYAKSDQAAMAFLQSNALPAGAGPRPTLSQP